MGDHEIIPWPSKSLTSMRNNNFKIDSAVILNYQFAIFGMKDCGQKWRYKRLWMLVNYTTNLPTYVAEWRIILQPVSVSFFWFLFYPSVLHAFAFTLKYMLLGSKKSTVSLYILLFILKLQLVKNVGWKIIFSKEWGFVRKCAFFCWKIQLSLFFSSFFSGKVYEESKLSFNLHFLFFINFKSKPCLFTLKCHAKYFLQDFSTHFI